MTDDHVQQTGKKWEFDEKVTQVFPSMLKQSIPGLDDMRRFTTTLALNALTNRKSGTNPIVMDIGASRGDAVADIIETHPDGSYTLCEISQPMIQVLEERFGASDNVQIVSADLSENVEWMRRVRPNLVLSVLTLIFIPIENRQELIQTIYDSLQPGGAFIVVEKTLGDSAASQSMLVDTYHAFKHSQGYTPDVVERKRMSLKGTLVPVKPSWTENMLHDAGFKNIQQYWRALQFVGWIAHK